MGDNFIIRLCIPKKSVSVRVYSDDDKTIADRFNQFFLLRLKKQHIKKSNSSLMSEVMLQHSKPAAQQTCSPEFRRAEEFIFAKKGRLYIVRMLKRLYHHCLERKCQVVTIYQYLCTCYYSFYYCHYKFFFYHQHLFWRLEDCESVTNLERG